jgi:beta-phosphoglucomutase-like phosphatase (HAD superfamily)
LTPFFEVIVTGGEIERDKPDPDVYLRAVEKLDVSPEASLVIEDSLSGVAGGKAAGTQVSAIPDRRFADAREYNKQGDYILGSVLEIAYCFAIMRSSY